MIAKYSDAARTSGALMFPQIGVESAPSDLVTWSLARQTRAAFGPSAGVRDVVVSVRVKGRPSGGTLSTVLTLFENFTLREVRDSHRPFALSPVPNPHPPPPAIAPSLWSRLTGVVTYPGLGLMTTSIVNRTDGAVVERTWGLLASVPSRKDQAYGPNFSFQQYMKARNFLTGAGIHFGLMVFGLVLATPFLRRFFARRVYQPGEGADLEEAKKDEIEYRGLATPDVAGGAAAGKKAYCRAWFNGPNYYCEFLLSSQLSNKQRCWPLANTQDLFFRGKK